MKLIIVIMLGLFSTSNFAKTRIEKEAEKREKKNAKSICLMNDNLMRGKRLKECIKEEMDKNKKAELKAQRREEQSI